MPERPEIATTQSFTACLIDGARVQRCGPPGERGVSTVKHLSSHQPVERRQSSPGRVESTGANVPFESVEPCRINVCFPLALLLETPSLADCRILVTLW